MVTEGGGEDGNSQTYANICWKKNKRQTMACKRRCVLLRCGHAPDQYANDNNEYQIKQKSNMRN